MNWQHLFSKKWPRLDLNPIFETSYCHRRTSSKNKLFGYVLLLRNGLV